MNTSTWIECPDFDTFPIKFLAAIHGSAFYSIPLNIFAIYMIVWKSPPAMKTYRWYLLNYQIWCCVLEIAINFNTPIIYVPILAGWTHGPFSALGVPFIWQFIFGISVLFGSMAAVLHMFCYRHVCMLPLDYPTRFSDRFYFYFRASLYTYYVAIFPPAMWLLVPDQDQMKSYIQQTYSCAPADLWESKVFVYTPDESRKPWFILAGFGILVLLLVCFGNCSWCVYDSYKFLNSREKSHMLSENSRRMQKAFMKALIIQVTIPCLIYLLPVGGIVVGSFTDYFNQELYNVLIFLMTIHGTVSSTVMLYVNTPYRLYIYSKISKVLKLKLYRPHITAVSITKDQSTRECSSMAPIT